MPCGLKAALMRRISSSPRPLMMRSFDWASSLLSPGVSGLIDMRVERCLQLGSRCRDWPHACDLGPLDVERRRHRERFGERQIDRTALLPGLVDTLNCMLVLRRPNGDGQADITHIGRDAIHSQKPARIRFTLRCCLNSIDGDAELRGERVSDEHNRAAG